ncbi:hypothetical protein BC827DRAFT_1155844 [Russula dissimulans]|nr:hypothetical protein BC827DRAFT_1155844 [Russula dissimulans]
MDSFASIDGCLSSGGGRSEPHDNLPPVDIPLDAQFYDTTCSGTSGYRRDALPIHAYPSSPFSTCVDRWARILNTNPVSRSYLAGTWPSSAPTSLTGTATASEPATTASYTGSTAYHLTALQPPLQIPPSRRTSSSRFSIEFSVATHVYVPPRSSRLPAEFGQRILVTISSPDLYTPARAHRMVIVRLIIQVDQNSDPKEGRPLLFLSQYRRSVRHCDMDSRLSVHASVPKIPHHPSSIPVCYSALVIAEALDSSNPSRVFDLTQNQFAPIYVVYENGMSTKLALFNFVTNPSDANDYDVMFAVSGDRTSQPRATPSSVKIRFLKASSVASKGSLTSAGRERSPEYIVFAIDVPQTSGNNFESDGLQRDPVVQIVNCDTQANTCSVKVSAPFFALVFLTDTASVEVSTARSHFLGPLTRPTPISPYLHIPAEITASASRTRKVRFLFMIF